MNSATSCPDNISAGLTTVNGVEGGSLPAADRGTSYGHGLFETMLFSDGAVPLWQRHLGRLVSDAPILGLSISEKSLEDNLANFLQLLAQQSQSSGIIKIMVTAGTGGRGYASPEKMAPQIICQFSPLPNNLVQLRQKGVALIQCQYALPTNPVLAGIKHLNRLDQVLAAAELKQQGAPYTDGVMFSHDSNLIETTCANIFIKTPEMGWLTPQLDQSGVLGVMRGLLLERLFNQSGLNVKECRINPQQLASASEIFICSSIRGLIPVTDIKDLGHWSIGPETKLLQSALFDLYDCYLC